MNHQGKQRLLVPALITGTSAEFMGGKPRPKLLRLRPTVFVLGPAGVGKSTVARLVLGVQRRDVHTRELHQALVARVKDGKWSADLADAPALLLDGPCWLRHRAGAQQLVNELVRDRAAAGRRTAICQVENDGSVEDLIASGEPGSAVVLGLRFPVGRRTRLRVARQVCRELDLPLEVTEGAERLDPWRYDLLVKYLVDRAWGPG